MVPIEENVDVAPVDDVVVNDVPPLPDLPSDIPVFEPDPEVNATMADVMNQIIHQGEDDLQRIGTILPDDRKSIFSHFCLYVFYHFFFWSLD